MYRKVFLETQNLRNIAPPPTAIIHCNSTLGAHWVQGHVFFCTPVSIECAYILYE